MPRSRPSSRQSLGRPFTYQFSASALTNLGDGILLAAGPLLIASINPSPALVGGAVFIQQLPWLLFALFSGALVDRLDERRLVVAVNIARAFAMALLAVLVISEFATVPIVYIALFVLGVGETIADSGSSALTVASVPSDELGRANARLNLTFTTGNQLIGPPVGAALFGLGVAVPSITQAVTFAMGAVLISRMRVDSRHSGKQRASVRGVLSDVREGLAWLRTSRPMRTLMAAIFVMNIAFTGAFATWVLYCTKLLGLNNYQFGLLITCAAIGALFGPFAYGKLYPRLGYAGILRVGFLFEATLHTLLGSVPPALVVAAAMVLFGLYATVWGVAAVTLRQQSTPRPLLGRVTSAYSMANVGGSAIGAALGAGVAEVAGLTAGFWAAAVLMLIVAICTWRSVGTLESALKSNDV